MRFTRSASHRSNALLATALGCLACLLLAAPAADAASAGNLDRSFSGDGRQTTDFRGDESGAATAIQPDGKIVVVGAMEQFRDPPFLVMARYRPDGSLDPTFSQDGKLTLRLGGFGAQATAVAIRGSKIIVAGTFYSESGDSDLLALRLNADGTFDKSFSEDGRAHVDFGQTDTYGEGLAVDDQARVVLSGTVYKRDYSSDFAVARLRPNGRLDTSFAGDGKRTVGVREDDMVGSLALTPNGRILVAGTTDGAGDERFPPDDFALVRLTAGGDLDPGFSSDGRVTTNIRSSDGLADLAVGSDGRAVAVGTSFPANFSDADTAVVRYLPNGTLDSSFSDDGRLLVPRSDSSGAVAVQPDRKIVLSGNRFLTIRLRRDGRFDPSFSDDGRAATRFGPGSDRASDVALGPNGKILAIGTTDGNDFALARFFGVSTAGGG